MSQVLSLVPTNQQEFSQGQKCIIDIPPNIGYFKAGSAGSYLALDILNDSADKVRWMTAGSAHTLISQVDIFTGSGAGGILLESLTNYAQISQIIDLYTHNDYTPLESKEGMRRPAEPYEGTALRSTGSVRLIDVGDAEKQAVNGQFSPIDTAGVAKYTSRRVCLALKSGIFNYFDSEKLVPNGAMSGIRMEITFSQNDECLAAIAGTQDGTVKGLYGTGLVSGAALVGATTLTVTDTTIATCGLAVGNQITVTDAVPVTADRTITALAQNGADVDITVAALPALGAGVVKLKADSLPSFKITKAEYRCMEIVPPTSMMIKGAFKYMFRTWKHFIDTIPSSSRKHVVELQTVASRAKAIMSMFVDASLVSDPDMPRFMTGANADGLNMNSVVYYIGNKLYPLRSYDPRSKRDRVLTQNEVVKAISSTGRMPLSLGSSKSHDLDCYSSIFLVARALAERDGFSFPLKDKEPQIRLGFSAARAFNTRVHTFIFEENVVVADSSGLRVEY
ncbi:MAG: hypothetical protein ACR2M9_01505 [Cyanophyceae cyanobacterium]